MRRARVWLAFDGPPDPPLAEFDAHHRGPLGISYPPPGGTADDVIFRILDGHSDPRSLTVVSSDREIREYARHKGAKVETCVQFNRTLKAAGRAFRRLAADDKEDISLSTLELAQWMDLFESHDRHK